MIEMGSTGSGVSIRIGSYQGPVVENNPEANLQKVRKVMDQHARELDFLCFPEAFLSGYAPDSIRASALSTGDARFQALVAATAAYDTVVLVGMSELRMDGIYNSQAVLYQGQLMGVQTKTMLTQGYDSLYYHPEMDLKVFEAKGIRFGVAICHSTSFVEPALYLRLKGVRLLFTPHFNDIAPQIPVPGNRPFTSSAHRDLVLNNQAALATLLKMVVVRSNVVVVRPDHLGWGDSNIWDMDGIVAARGEPFTECVVKAAFPQEIFTSPGFINRKEVPLPMYRMIADAAEQYLADPSLS